MPRFPLADGSYRYRALKRHDSGYDVYALQTALNELGAALITDGFFGPVTEVAIRDFQSQRNLTRDGIAGVATQQKLTEIICRRVRRSLRLPRGIPYGHAEHESSCLLGNHTAPYANGSRDCGVVQRNTQFTPVEEGFNVPLSIKECAQRFLAYREKYLGWGVEERRALELACGSWNAPAWTDQLARGESLSPAARDHIERYIAAVTVYAR